MIEYSRTTIDDSSFVATPTARDTMRQWRFRPLICCAMVVVCGAAMGFQSARYFDVALQSVPRTFCLLVWLLSMGAVLWSNRFDSRSLDSRSLELRSLDSRSLSLLALFFASALLSSQRVVAPRDDISRWVGAASLSSTSRMTPQKPLQLMLRGVVASRPRGGEFGLEFPLRIERATLIHNEEKAQHRVLDAARNSAHSRVWARFPLPQKDDIALREGDMVEVRALLFDLPRAGNWGERETRNRMIRENCWSMARVQKDEKWRVVRSASATSLAARLDIWRGAIVTRYETSFRDLGAPYSASNAQLLSALVWGEGGLREPLPRQTRERFRAAGMSHVLVASGTQVAVFCGILIFLTRAVGLRRWSWILVLLPLVLYALLAGGASSIWRATVAGICVAVALSWGRDIDGLSLWSLALIVLFALDPTQLQDIGFQLTFAATWGLLALAPTLNRVLEHVWKPSFMLNLAAFSLAAQIATTPILLYHFGRISLAAFGTSFFAIPIAGVLVSTGMLGLFLPLTHLNLWLVQSLDAVATMASRVPGAQTELPPLRLGWTLFLYAALCCALSVTSSTRWAYESWQKLADKWRGLRPQSVMTWAILALCCVAIWRIANTRDGRVRVTLLDVGQGESIVIRAPSGRTVLVDGGTSSDEGRGEVGRAIIVPYLKAMGVARLDAVILTHADADHCSALPFVAREIPIDLALDGTALHATSSTRNGDALPPEYEETLSAWRQNNVPIEAARAGQKLDLGDDVVLTILAPQSSAITGLSENDAAAVVRLDYGETSVLLTADIETEAEQQLVRSGANLKCTVLKIAHHGSKTSTTAPFLTAAQPSAAIVSAGRYNKYRHPAPRVMNDLSRAKIKTYRTDLDGAIEVACDGQECDVTTFR